MHQIRYTFPTTKKGKYLYALGGRVYGSDDVSIL